MELRLLSVEQVATLLGISKSTVYLYGRCGKLKKTKIGSRVLYTMESIQEFIEQNTH